MIKNIFVGVFLFTFVSSVYCQHSGHMNGNESKSSEEVYSCPFLTKNSSGKTNISWVMTKSGESTLYYATYDPTSDVFKDTIVIAPSKGLAPHGENLPKIISKPSGETIALWGIKNSNPKNKYSGLISYSQSFDNGKTWSPARPLATNPESFDQRYFDVALLPNGEAAITWLDNPNDPNKEGSNVYFATTKGKDGFQGARVIGETACQCCRTDLLVDKKGNIHVAYRDILNDSIRDMVYTFSVDEGRTFSKPKRISDDNWKITGCPHTGPSMAINNGIVHFAWFTKGGETGVFYSNSKDKGKSFSKRKLISSEARHPQMIAWDNGDLAIVFEEEQSDQLEVSSDIVLVVRNSKGEFLNYKVEERGKGSFPVISELGKNAFLVAWTEETELTNEHSEVVHKQVIKFKKIEFDKLLKNSFGQN